MPVERMNREQKDQGERAAKRQMEHGQPEAAGFDPGTADLAQLQRMLGNQAVQRMLAEGRIKPAGVQPKLTVGAPNDIYEQEADRTAAAVMRAEVPQEEELLQARRQPDALMRAEVPEEEDELQMKPLMREGEEEELLQAEAEPGGAFDVTGDVENRIEGARGGGVGLADSARAFFEPRFGEDFSGVKIHTGAEADTLNRAINARAFTTGQDIFFREGEYNPDSDAGRELLAHELTHVVQQGGGRDVTRKVEERIQRDDPATNPRAFEQKDIYYEVLEQSPLEVEKTNTFWGTVPNAMDDSYFKTLLPGWWRAPQMKTGIGELGAHLSFVDWRDTIYLNDQFLPSLDVSFRFQQQDGHEQITPSPGAADYKPDGGGAMQVILNYTYGGSRTEDGKKYGYHSVLLTFIYSSQTSRTSGVSVEIGAEAKGEGGGVGGKLGASASTTVSDAALSFTKELRFRSYSI